MSWKLSLCAGATLTALSLVSCVAPGKTSKDGGSIYYPTVTEMESYEKQWGMDRKSAPSRPSSPDPGAGAGAGAYVPSSAVIGAPQPSPDVLPLEGAQPTMAPAIPPSLR